VGVFGNELEEYEVEEREDVEEGDDKEDIFFLGIMEEGDQESSARFSNDPGGGGGGWGRGGSLETFLLDRLGFLSSLSSSL
jgi:hypothetical protein